MHLPLSNIIKDMFRKGIGETLAQSRYCLKRDYLNKRFFKKEKISAAEESPGVLVQADAFSSGAIFNFTRATLEVYFLAPDVVRISWSPGQAPLPYALADEKWPEAEVNLEPKNRKWKLKSESLSLSIADNGAISFKDFDNHVLRRTMPPARRGNAWKDRAYLHPRERIHGLGERAAALNLRPGTYCMWNQDPQGSYAPGTDPLYLCIPVYLGRHSEGTYLLFYENSHQGVFSFDPYENEARAEASFSAGMLRYYFFAGPAENALENYTRLTGRPCLPPAWALGYHHSKWGYVRETDLRAVGKGFQEHDLPLDALHLDIDHQNGFKVFTVDKVRFPDLKQLANDFAEQGISLICIVNPGIKKEEGFPVYDQGKSRNLFCSLPNQKELRARVWPGWSVFPDFSSSKVRNWWAEQYTALLEQGIKGFWHDMNEPAVLVTWGDPTLPISTQFYMEGRYGNHLEGHNLYALLMARSGYEALIKHAPEKRPWLLTRSGWAGVQRYAWTWTGDTQSSWPALRQTIATVLGLGLSGIAFSGPDIGGFSGKPPAELYIRWLQLATFLPFFRCHCSKNSPSREPWVFGKPYLKIAHFFLHLRKSLQPFLYTLAWQASKKGYPLVRPLFWNFEQETLVQDVQDAFMLGNELLIAPILEENSRQREIQVPDGLWHDFWDDSLVKGGDIVSVQASLESIPILVRAGSILPMLSGKSLIFHIYPPEEEARGIIYTDCGDGYDQGREDTISVKRSKQALELHWESRGEFAWPYESVLLKLHGTHADKTWVDGMERDWEQEFFELESFERMLIVLREA